MSSLFLHIWPPGQENEQGERGPLYMESALAALHSLRGSDSRIAFEVGLADNKVGFYAHATETAAALVESQIYAQYPETDIERLEKDPFMPRDGEFVASLDFTLGGPDIFPIKRHPQFDDLLSRINVDPLAAITSTLARYPLPGMRGHVQVIVQPLGGAFRRRALRFLPLLGKGLPSLSPGYANFFARVVLSRGWKRLAYFPLVILMGGFRSWPVLSRLQGLSSESAKPPADEEEGRISARSHDREDSVAGARDKVNRQLFLCNVRISVITHKSQRVAALQKLQEIASAFQQFTLPNSNGFASGKLREGDRIDRSFLTTPFILSTEEVATLWHVPTIHVQTTNLDRVISKKLEPPVNLPVPGVTDDDHKLTVLGASVFQGRRVVFGIRTDDRRRHIYIIGKTGMGKTTILENMIFSDIQSDRGIAVIDPHGDLINSALQFVPKHRTNDVVLFDPADRAYPLSFNILECANPDQRPLVCSGLMSVFTKLWPEAFSGRMEHILRNTLLALLENEGTSMLGILRMYADDAYRAKIVERVTDPLVKSFWESEYAGWTDKYRTEAVAAIQNKIGQLLSTPVIRNIIGQVHSSLDIRHAMDTGKIVLVNLSKGRIGEDTSAFLGSMLVTKFQIDAMSRADIAEKDRRDFFLYVDEFQNFATESFATILSEARKYRLSLTMANQYVSQLIIGQGNTTLRDAVFGNVGSLISFQVGSDDAEVLSLQFEEMLTPKDILSLPKYHAYMRLMIDGITSKPFSVATLPPPKFAQDEGRVDILRDLSRERYAQKREVVEEKISKWASASAEGKVMAKTTEKAKEKEEEERKKARAKNMTLEEYRTWRDREMWTNEFNAIRKKQMLQQEITDAEQAKFVELEQKLAASGGVPPPSKSMLLAAGLDPESAAAGQQQAPAAQAPAAPAQASPALPKAKSTAPKPKPRK